MTLTRYGKEETMVEKFDRLYTTLFSEAQIKQAGNYSDALFNDLYRQRKRLEDAKKLEVVES